MAAIKTKYLSDETRLKIKTSQIINRLTSFINGEVEMQPAQVTAALGLLKKSLPDLSAVELKNDPVNPIGNAKDIAAEVLKHLDTTTLEKIIADERPSEPQNYH